ncbi:hypothetical protein CDL12_24040 [Handroanthus impetiginosus]|uniref:Uncharacterized protein n=1 Tax=Handroanthus impetiginosus TaxID=429701 RepID=A0A2G9GDZ9_9LAMI|nr:hypothetical protein CDL12_24040 [Handroanthus impetiginosus]
MIRFVLSNLLSTNFKLISIFKLDRSCHLDDIEKKKKEKKKKKRKKS